MGRNHASRNPGRRLPAAVAGCGLLLSGARAQAHTTFPGLGEYASGFLHPLTTPPHLLVLLALGLWLGQRPPLRIREPAATFAGGALLGLALTAVLHVGALPAAIFAMFGLGIGACVAGGFPVPFWARLGVCGIAALVLGMDSGVDAGTPPAAVVKILGATWGSLALCVVNIAFYVSLLPTTRPVQIGVRIVGSWIVAIALLLLAFALRR